MPKIEEQSLGYWPVEPSEMYTYITNHSGELDPLTIASEISLLRRKCIELEKRIKAMEKDESKTVEEGKYPALEIRFDGLIYYLKVPCHQARQENRELFMKAEVMMAEIVRLINISNLLEGKSPP